MKYENFCTEWMNQYPVLSLSFKDVEGLDFDSAFKMLKSVIADLCKKYAFLEKDEKVLSADAEIFRRLQYETADLVIMAQSMVF